VFGVVAFASGALRQAVLAPALGDHAAHQVGSLIAAGVMGGIAVWFIRRLRPTITEALTIGALWVAMTVAFEIGYFRFGQGEPWQRFLQDYSVFQGRLWILVLVVQLVTPYLVVRRRGLGAAT
jgi:hypothetical protein